MTTTNQVGCRKHMYLSRYEANLHAHVELQHAKTNYLIQRT